MEWARAMTGVPSMPGLPPLHNPPDSFPFCLDGVDSKDLEWQSHEKKEPGIWASMYGGDPSMNKKLLL